MGDIHGAKPGDVAERTDMLIPSHGTHGMHTN